MGGESPSHHWLEIAYWISQIALPFIAIGALIFARGQVLNARNANKVMLLVNLDERWESSSMQRGRRYLNTLREFVTKDTLGRPGASTPTQVSIRMAGELQQLSISDERRYLSVMEIIGFFETLGYIRAKGYLDLADIKDLYGSAILEFDNMCGEHLKQKKRVLETRLSRKVNLYDHAANLAATMREIYNKP